jgi:SET domain
VTRVELQRDFKLGGAVMSGLQFLAKVRELEKELKLTLCQALFFANSFQECDHFLKHLNNSQENNTLGQITKTALVEERKRLQTKGLDEDELEEDLRAGSIAWRPYPWMGTHRTQRSPDTVAFLKSQMEKVSLRRCTIKHSTTIREHDTETIMERGDSIGVFARYELPKGCEILLESTAFGGCSEMARCDGCCGDLPQNSIHLQCCDKDFCSQDCADLIIQDVRPQYHNYHKLDHLQYHNCHKRDHREAHDKIFFRDIFGKSRKVTEPFRSNDEITTEEMAEAKLFEKILASTVNAWDSSSQHPLDCLSMRGLTTAKGSVQEVGFSFEKDVVWPFNMLHQLGIDIWSNPAFDGWVLQTIKAKMRANSWEREVGETQIQAISTLFSYFNHSCSSNAKWEHVGSGTTLKVTTIRPIVAGEEIFISYLCGEDLTLVSRAKRQERLQGWFKECLCSRCKREAEEQENHSDADVIFVGERIRRCLSVSVRFEPARPSPKPLCRKQRMPMRQHLPTPEANLSENPDYSDCEVTEDETKGEGMETRPKKRLKR